MGIARKLVVSANEEGIVLQHVASKGQRLPQTLLIKYGDALASSIPRERRRPGPSTPPFEAFGVIGTAPSVLAVQPRLQQLALANWKDYQVLCRCCGKLPHNDYAPRRSCPDTRVSRSIRRHRRCNYTLFVQAGREHDCQQLVKHLETSYDKTRT